MTNKLGRSSVSEPDQIRATKISYGSHGRGAVAQRTTSSHAGADKNYAGIVVLDVKWTSDSD